MLSDEQILELYAYCNRKSIGYYDLQVEIVDHMANAIKEKMLANPAMEFKQALEEVHISFGSFGLREIVAEKSKAMQRRYGKMRRQIFGSYFTLPRITFTLLLVVVGISFERVLPNFLLPYVLIMMGGVLIYLFIRQELMKRKFKKKQLHKLLMTDPQFFDYSFLPLILMFQFGSKFFRNGIFHITDADSIHIVEYYFAVFVFVLYIILTLVRKEMLMQVNEKARNSYPNVFAR